MNLTVAKDSLFPMTTPANPDAKLSLASHDVVAENLEALKDLFPEAIVEGRVDLERLRQHLGEFTHVRPERYGLNWAGKSDAIRTLQQPSYATLTPDRTQSVNFDTTQNLIIEGDNLEVLKLLQKSYYGKIKMIYIDPPYNTGGDFVYPDNFKEGLDTYLRFSGQLNDEGLKVSTNTESGGRYHSNWLNMMYPRLFLAKSLLSDDGLIFISIDDHETANLRIIMNEVFGEENFIGQFIWKSRVSEDTRAKTGVSTDHEYILCFSRISGSKLEGTEKDLEKFSNPDNDPRGPWRSADLTGLATKEQRPNLHYELIDLKTGINYGCPPKGWRFDSTTMKQKINEGRVLWPASANGRPRHKLFLNEMKSKFKNISTVLSTASTSDGTKEVNALLGNNFFDFPKPSALIKALIAQGTAEDSVILDFFAGSGTTADAVLQLNKEVGGNRKFILVQLPEPTEERSEARKAGLHTIADITRERVRRVIATMQVEATGKLINTVEGPDLGFKAFKLTSSNFKLWNPDEAPADGEALAQQLALYVHNVLPGRTDEALLYEIILKAGFPLTASIEPQTMGNQTVYAVDGGALLVCLADPIQEATLQAMLAAKPVKMVVLDIAFHGNDQLKTNLKLQAEQTGDHDTSRVQFLTV